MSTIEIPRRAVIVNPSEPALGLVEQLVGTGLFGDDASECMTRMIDNELQRLVASGFIHVEAAEEDEEPQVPRELGAGGAAAAAASAASGADKPEDSAGSIL